MAAILGVSAPAVLAFVDELEDAGLVSRQRNRADRRAYDLTLTERGVEVLGQALRVAHHLQSDITEVLGAKADAELRGLLGKVIATGTYAAAASEPHSA
jgi:DNA-binding MarR family transcriptional regulator